jgi:hypothetical protein
MTGRSLFTREAGGWSPTEDAVAPWDTTVLPGGPVAALLAHATQSQRPNATRLAQLDVLLLAPTPQTTLSPEAAVVHRGRDLTVVEAAILHNGNLTARATAVYLVEDIARHDSALPVSVPERYPLLDLGEAIPPSHLSALEIRPITRPDPARDAAWIHYPGSITDDAESDPTLHAVLVSDVATALLWADRASLGHINPTLTVHLVRPPVGLDTAMVPDTVTPTFGACHLYDRHGHLGNVTITALRHPQRRATA